MQERVRGLVLRLFRYADDRLVAEVFTEPYGTLSFFVREKRGKKGSVQSMLLRPLNIVEMELDYRPTATMQHIRELRMCYMYETLPYDVTKSTVALFLGEFLRQALRQEVANASLFCFMADSLELYDAMREGYANFHIAFLIRMTYLLGFAPNLEEYPDGMYFDLRDGILTDLPPLHGSYLTKEETALIPLMLRMTYRNMHCYHFVRQQRARIIDILIHYYRLHIPDFAAIKSLDVLREVLG